MIKKIGAVVLLLGAVAYFKRSPKTKSVGIGKAKGDLDCQAVCVSSWQPIDSINTNKALFQNRESDYSEDSVNKIIRAVQTGTFRWAYFDAITTWKDPADGKLYVLAGHSRRAAFLILRAQGATAENRGFEKIPTKIFTGTKEEAINFALNSNTLATPEKETERAYYYRQRLARGADSRIVEQECKTNEAANARRIWSYSFLSPTGTTFAALKALESGEITSAGNIKVVAYWIGNVRKKYYFLTSLQEEELYAYLITEGYYGRKYRTEKQFAEDLDELIAKRLGSQKWTNSSPLNLHELEYKSPVRETYNEQLRVQRAKVADLCRQRSSLEMKLFKEGRTIPEIIEALQPIDRQAQAERVNLEKMKDKKQEVISFEKNNEISLFN